MLIPMAMLPEGKEAVIVDVKAGRGLTRRLYELGFVRGERVRVLRAGFGPILVEVKGSRMALGWGVAMKVLVADYDGEGIPGGCGGSRGVRLDKGCVDRESKRR